MTMINLLRLALLLTLLVLGGCTRGAPAAPTDPGGTPMGDYGDEQLYDAFEMGQIILQDGGLNIPVSALQEKEYVDEQGNPQRGPTAILTFSSAADPSIDFYETVHEGQILYVGDYRIRVTDINLTNKHVVIKVATRR